MKQNTKTSVIAVVAALTTSFTALAGAPVKDVVSKPEASSVFEAKINADVVTNYTYRGVLLDSNPVFQPGLSVTVPLSLSFVDSAKLVAQTTQTFGTKTPNNNWYRSDSQFGVSLTQGKFTLTPTYVVINSPHGTFKSSQGVNVSLEYKDELGVNPHGAVFVGTEGKSGNGTSSGNYYEVGIEPSKKVGNVTVSVPVNVGFGASNYYKNNQSYGYTSAGAKLQYALTTRASLYTSATFYNTSSNLNEKTHNWSTTTGLSYAF